MPAIKNSSTALFGNSSMSNSSVCRIQTSQDPIFQEYADLTMTCRIYFQPSNKFDEWFCHGDGRARFERKAAVKQCRRLTATSNVCGKKSPRDNVDGSEIRLSPVWYGINIPLFTTGFIMFYTSKQWLGMEFLKHHGNHLFWLQGTEDDPYDLRHFQWKRQVHLFQRGTEGVKGRLCWSVCQVASWWCENVEWCCGC